jgi:UbiD family decarboxylase
MRFDGLRPFLKKLEEHGQLVRVQQPVSPYLEIPTIIQRVVRAQGPALLFEKVEGSPFPVVSNLFGNSERLRLALGGEPQQLGETLVSTVEQLKNPTLSKLWQSRKAALRLWQMRPRRVKKGPVLEVATVPNLNQLPILTCWPGDAERFFTLATTMTKHPVTGERNLGLYRLQYQSPQQTGMHWQIHRGGGFHYWLAEQRDEDLPVTVTLGGSASLIFSAAAPLPENMDEILLAGLLQGQGIPVISQEHSHHPEIIADAEIVLVGKIPAKVRQQEGPFGDHFGHYSHVADFPVFQIEKMYHRKDAIFPATVVGKPPQEDWWWGNALQAMMVPLLRLVKPEIVDLWTYPETGFHGLGVLATQQRYAKEGIRSAMGLLGEGQMSLTKCLVIVDADCPVHSLEEVFQQIHRYFDPTQDLIIIPGTPYDTLDFTSRKMNLGSKMIIDASSGTRPSDRPATNRPLLQRFSNQYQLQWYLWKPSIVAIQVPKSQNGQTLAQALLQTRELDGLSLIVLVSEDVPIDDPVLFLWGWFTRFEPARDLYFKNKTFTDAVPRYEGPVVFDATWKPGYPAPLELDPDVERNVEQKWQSYGIPN